MRHRPDVFSGNLFEEENPIPPELLHEVSGDDGKPKVVDTRGNEYDHAGYLAKERPSDYLTEALRIVKRLHPDVEIIQPGDPEVQFYVRQLRIKAEGLPKKVKKRTSH